MLYCWICLCLDNLCWDQIPASSAVARSFLACCKLPRHQQQTLSRLPSKHTVPPRTGPAALSQLGTIFEILCIFQPSILDMPKPPEAPRYASQLHKGGLGEPRKMASLGNSLRKAKGFAPTIATAETSVLPFLPTSMTWPAFAN